MFGTMRTALQCLQIIRVIPFKPSVKRLWGDAEIPAGQASVVTVGTVVIKPLQPITGFMRNIPYPFPYGKATRSKSVSYLHPSAEGFMTPLYSVTYLSELLQSRMPEK